MPPRRAPARSEGRPPPEPTTLTSGAALHGATVAAAGTNADLTAHRAECGQDSRPSPGRSELVTGHPNTTAQQPPPFQTPTRTAPIRAAGSTPTEATVILNPRLPHMATVPDDQNRESGWRCVHRVHPVDLRPHSRCTTWNVSEVGQGCQQAVLFKQHGFGSLPAWRPRQRQPRRLPAQAPMRLSHAEQQTAPRRHTSRWGCTPATAAPRHRGAMRGAPG